MTTAVARLWSRSPSPALRRSVAESIPLSDAVVRRRIAWIWGLLFLNVLPYSAKSSLVPVPTSVGKAVTQGALLGALVLALSINRKVMVRPNLFLFLMTVLCATTAMMSIRGYFSYGSIYRSGRFIEVVAVLWLLTPWWGRDDLLLLRYHRRAILVVLFTILAGLVLTPGAALAQAGGGRLGGAIWPIPPTQVAHFSAVLVGVTVVLWFSGMVAPRVALAVTAFGTAILVLTHTRTALVALLVGIVVAGMSLFISRQRVRKFFAVALIGGGLVALSLAPFLTGWFTRGQSGTELDALTGRTATWSAVIAEPRTEINTLFGYGMSNDSFEGLPIDSSWLSTYLDQGLVGDVIDGSVLILLVAIALLSPPGPRRAVALFLVVYCALASVTETGLGEASPYLLDLTVAMAVLMTPLSPRAEVR